MARQPRQRQQKLKSEIRTVEAKLSYCQEALASGTLETWEAKEYAALVSDYDAELIELHQLLYPVA